MPLQDWFRPPRQIMLVFLVVALVSTGALGWLTWHLLAEDRAADLQRRLEDLERAADAATATMLREVATLDRYLDAQPSSNEPLPPGTMVLSDGPGGLVVKPNGSLLYYPVAVATTLPDSGALVAAQELELAREDLKGAARAYAALGRSDNPALRATALARLARVHRKRGARAAALVAYRQLGALQAIAVDDLPAALVARVGRASLFEETHDAANLVDEARALGDDLRAGRLQVTESQYRYYLGEAHRWLGTSVPPAEPDANTRAEAVAWLWQHRRDEGGRERRLVVFNTGAALILWQPRPASGGIAAVIVGPTPLGHLATAAIPPGTKWALADLEGHLAAGDPLPARHTTTRTSSATTLPWTFHLFSSTVAGETYMSPRRTRLFSIVAAVACVLVAGWYFIWRGISREIRVARLQSDFVAAVSHEFRSPLTSLRHIAELLAADRFPSEDRRRRSYALLVGETDRLSRLVEGLLDFGRFQAGKATVHREPVELAELVRSVVDECQVRVRSPERVLELAITATEAVVTGDRDALARSLWNLLDNAIKYSPHGGVIRVSLTEGPLPGWVSVAVRDKGIGVPKHEQRQVFDRFVRGAEATSRRIQGTGIGLAMVREIVQAHGGHVQVESEAGAGSTFTLTLPALQTVATEVMPRGTTAAVLPPEAPTPETASGSERV